MSSEHTPRASLWRRWFGSRSERAAARFLKRLGYRILARNYVCPLGELDLIALDGACVVFVEVRSTSSKDSTRAAESVDQKKQRQLAKLALSFLHKHHLLESPARFDVLALSWPSDQRDPVVTHYRSAFEPPGRFQMYD